MPPLIWDGLVHNPEHLLPGISLECHFSAGKAPLRLFQGEFDFLKSFHAALRVWEILLRDCSRVKGSEEENGHYETWRHTAVSGQSPTVVPQQSVNPLDIDRPGQTEPIHGTAASGGIKQQNNFG